MMDAVHRYGGTSTAVGRDHGLSSRHWPRGPCRAALATLFLYMQAAIRRYAEMKVTYAWRRSADPVSPLLGCGLWSAPPHRPSAWTTPLRARQHTRARMEKPFATPGTIRQLWIRCVSLEDISDVNLARCRSRARAAHPYLRVDRRPPRNRSTPAPRVGSPASFDGKGGRAPNQVLVRTAAARGSGRHRGEGCGGANLARLKSPSRIARLAILQAGLVSYASPRATCRWSICSRCFASKIATSREQFARS